MCDINTNNYEEMIMMTIRYNSDFCVHYSRGVRKPLREMCSSERVGVAIYH